MSRRYKSRYDNEDYKRSDYKQRDYKQRSRSRSRSPANSRNNHNRLRHQKDRSRSRSSHSRTYYLRSTSQRQNHDYWCGVCLARFPDQKSHDETCLITCKLCQLQTCKIGAHLQQNHFKCRVCVKWFQDQKTHDDIQTKTCELCQLKTCKIGAHLQETHYNCSICKQWFNDEKQHQRLNCLTCENEICDMNKHVEENPDCKVKVRVTYEPPPLPKRVKAKKKPLFITVKKTDDDGKIQVIRKPYGILELNS